MNNVLVYCELTESNHIADISLELCTKGRHLATEMNGRLQAVVAGSNIQGVAAELYPYGVDEVFIADDPRLSPYRTLPHFAVALKVIQEQQPNVVLFGATTVGRDLAPRVASRLRCGLTADCTALELGDHTDAKTGKEYKCTLHQIRPAFGGNIIATIVSPEVEPHMATVREGVMRKEVFQPDYKGTATKVDISNDLEQADKAVTIIRREIVKKDINIKGASIIVAGGYGMGSRENFKMLHDLARLIGGEVGGTRAACDAGFTEPERQIGQTGVTVRPRLYIACGISGAVQHRAGMDQSSKIISINTDPNAPINAIADYTIIGDVCTVVPMLMECYSNNLK